jgi:hypothetical protein
VYFGFSAVDGNVVARSSMSGNSFLSVVENMDQRYAW